MFSSRAALTIPNIMSTICRYDSWNVERYPWHPVKYEQGECQIALGSLLVHQPRERLQQKLRLCRCLHSLGDQATVLKMFFWDDWYEGKRNIIKTLSGVVPHIPVYGIR